jgi:hypothetical protein
MGTPLWHWTSGRYLFVAPIALPELGSRPLPSAILVELEGGTPPLRLDPRPGRERRRPAAARRSTARRDHLRLSVTHLLGRIEESEPPV